jgi:glutathione S-transferase
MKLYGCPNTRSLRVTWALEEAGADYDFVLVDLFKGEGRRPEFLAINPGGKVPVLVDGDLVLTESAAILAYLGERFPDSGLVPDDARQRARCWCWSCFAVTELEQPLWTIAKHRFALPKERRVGAMEQTAVWEFAQAAALLVPGLGAGEFILGERFCAADILVGHTLAWARSARVPLGSAALETYLDRLMARPAVARAQLRERRPG